MKFTQMTQGVVVLATMMLASSCSSIPSDHVARPTRKMPGATELALNTTTRKQPVSLTAAAAMGVAWAAQHPEQAIKIAQGTGRAVKGIYSAIAGEKKPEPIPVRAAGSQGIYGQSATY